MKVKEDIDKMMRVELSINAIEVHLLVFSMSHFVFKNIRRIHLLIEV